MYNVCYHVEYYYNNNCLLMKNLTQTQKKDDIKANE